MCGKLQSVTLEMFFFSKAKPHRFKSKNMCAENIRLSLFILQLLLYEETKGAQYSRDVTAFVRQYMQGGSVPHTPCGLAYRDQWGANRYAG